ncbi:hypothetical protein BCON_0064g00090 [Botryotinia convoluta]|uniref:Uncharacterized protein n=1 Tax=Botryotinia convoluta TaxID=54673 RepID=A0A4Z1ID85_9HELO|nr:hypothetical protein BCON_0064g00090 [Botryotinia convoluta]
MFQNSHPTPPPKMPSKFYTNPEYQNKKEPPHRRTGCITCDEGYMSYIPPARDPHLLRQEFRRRPLNAPKLAPLYIPGSLNHNDIASLRPQVQPGQEEYAFLTDWQQKKLAKARGKQGGFSVPEEDGWWEEIFSKKVFWRGIILFGLIYCLAGSGPRTA